MDVTYDVAGTPELAVGRGAPTLEEPCRWVQQHRTPMIFQGSDGGFVLIYCIKTGQAVIEPWLHVFGQAQAAARARDFLASYPGNFEHAEPMPRRRQPQHDVGWEPEAGG